MLRSACLCHTPLTRTLGKRIALVEESRQARDRTATGCGHRCCRLFRFRRRGRLQYFWHQPVPSSGSADISSSGPADDYCTITQGASIPGILKVTNRSADTVNITTDNGCSPGWAVVLRNSEVTTEPFFSAVCFKRPLVIAPGATDLSVTISSRFSACRNDASSSSTNGAPICEQDGPPPLPVGEYEAVFFSDSSEFPEPPPVKVQVVAR